jgi:hypothetical protein
MLERAERRVAGKLPGELIPALRGGRNHTEELAFGRARDQWGVEVPSAESVADQADAQAGHRKNLSDSHHPAEQHLRPPARWHAATISSREYSAARVTRRSSSPTVGFAQQVGDHCPGPDGTISRNSLKPLRVLPLDADDDPQLGVGPPTAGRSLP